MSAVPPTASAHPERWKFDFPIFHAESRAAWRAWLVEHHGTERGVWLCSWKAATGRPTCAYADAVEEALCFGWIDSTVNTLDDERGMQQTCAPLCVVHQETPEVLNGTRPPGSGERRCAR